MICPSCGRGNPEGFQFCGFCGARFGSALDGGDERKFVTVVFCDLVGFTAASEHADPEDVTARLRPYHARVRVELERHGGSVEKFIGDAVMAVFGAPVAHEDDAERAVRAALCVLDGIEQLNADDPRLALRVRIGINTGEVLVNRGARAELGEAMVAGDVVNTAARLQSAAPVGGIAVGELTHALTSRVFDFEPLEPVQAKGKAAPVAAFRPIGVHVDTRPRYATGLVGREAELARLQDALGAARRERRMQLVTVVGEPGIGKSRLVAEFRARVQASSDAPIWRGGRCLPYGDGIAFWALGEIVKVHAGIYDSDTVEVAEEKLDAVLPAVPERAWLRARMLPLLGIDAGQSASRDESFAAWARFLEMLSGQGAVIVVEDLHWADPALVDFIAELDLSTPLLLLCTSRAELDGLNAGWPDGGQTLSLAPLSRSETLELISELAAGELPGELERLILERADGNPLFAEEVVRLLAARATEGRLQDIPIPHSVQALIAARLDTLSADRKRVLQDAAVVGSVFWQGALAAMAGRAAVDVEVALRELVGKELVRSGQESSIEGEIEHAFWHILIRDVAYAEIPRARRPARHRAAAEWIEAKAGDRVSDLAEVIAHHYLAALELSRGEEARELQDSAIRYLGLAATRTLPLDVAAAEISLAKALKLAPADHPARASLLERWAEAAEQLGRPQEAKSALENAVAIYRSRGEPIATGRALTTLSHHLARVGDSRWEPLLAEAVALLETQAPGPELIHAYTQMSGRRYISADYRASIDAAENALALASTLGLEEPGRALGFRGGSRACLGDRRGLADMRRALALAIAQGKGRDAAVIHTNLAIEVFQFEGPAKALEACREGIEFAERRGIAEFALGINGTSLSLLLDLGRVDEALDLATELAARAQQSGAVAELVEARSVELRVFAYRGRHDEVQKSADEFIALGRAAGEPQQLVDCLGAGALVYSSRPTQARALLAELEQVPNARIDQTYAALLPELVRGAIAVADLDLASRFVDGVEPLAPLWEHTLISCQAQLAEAATRYDEAARLYEDAADRCLAFGRVLEHAWASLGLGRCLHRLGAPDADTPLRKAHQLFSSFGFEPAAAQAANLLDSRAASL